MQLNLELFGIEFGRLSKLLHVRPEDYEALFKIYYEALSHLSDDRFEQTCKAALTEIETNYLPKPAWFIKRAREIGQREATSGMPALLPAAETTTISAIESVLKANNAHIAVYMARRQEQYASLWHSLITTRKVARSRLYAGNNKIPDILLANLVETDAEVIEAKQAIEIFFDQGDIDTWEECLFRPWSTTRSYRQMQAIKSELEADTPDEIEYNYEDNCEEF